MLCRSRRASSRTRHAVRRDQGGSTANARSAARALPSGWRTIPEGCRSCDSESDAWPFRKDGERTRPCIEYGMQCCVAPVGASLKAPASARRAARRTGSRTAMRAPGFPCAFDGSRCRRYRHAPRRAFRRMHRAGSAGFTGPGRPLPLSGRNRRAILPYGTAGAKRTVGYRCISRQRTRQNRRSCRASSQIGELRIRRKAWSHEAFRDWMNYLNAIHAEAVRFELTDSFPSPVFKTGALNRSATLPDEAAL